MANVPDFAKSYFRFYIDFEGREAISLSHKPPTRTNRVRVMLESTCELSHRPSGRTTTYALSASCKTERVGAGKNVLWLMPNADAAFVYASDGQAGVLKSWHKNGAAVLRYPEERGRQLERQFFRAEDNYDDSALELRTLDALPLTDIESVKDAIRGPCPIVSRIEYEDGDFGVRIDQPVKTINIAERDALYQTDTGPIIVPDLSPERLERSQMEIEVFDLAYSAWHARDWAEFVLRLPMEIAPGITANHYSATRHIEPTRNMLFAVRDD